MFLAKKAIFPFFISSFFISVVFSVFWFLSLDVQWYKKEFIKLNVYEVVDKNTADQSISNIILYLQGKEPLDKNAFSSQARYHLFDVKIIFQVIRIVAIIATLLCAALLAYTAYALKWHDIIKYLNESLVVMCIFLFLIGIFIVFFHISFEIMHKFFFVNDLWLFDSYDPLIQLFPEKLFFDLVVRMYILLCLFSVFLLLPVFYIKKTLKINN